MVVRLQAAPSLSRPRANERDEPPLARGGLLILCAQVSNPSYPYHATAYTKPLLQHQNSALASAHVRRGPERLFELLRV